MGGPDRRGFGHRGEAVGGLGGEVNVNAAAGGATPIRRVMPIGGGVNGRPSGRLWSWGERTNVMAILNVTPDSFSDGGALMMDRYDDRHDPAVNVAAALAAARRAVESGADFLDVGVSPRVPARRA